MPGDCLGTSLDLAFDQVSRNLIANLLGRGLEVGERQALREPLRKDFGRKILNMPGEPSPKFVVASVSVLAHFPRSSSS